MAIIDKYFLKKYYPSGRYIWMSLVSCDNQIHEGNRFRLIALAANNGENCCFKCSNLTKKHTEEGKRKISERHKGSRNNFYGTKLSLDQKEKLASGRSKFYQSPEYQIWLSKMKELGISRRGAGHWSWNPNREEVKLNLKISAMCGRYARRLVKQDCPDWSPEQVLGYTYQEFKNHIESTWEPWMNWANHGRYKKGDAQKKWVVDHIKPISLFLKEGITDVKIINALSNLRAMEYCANSSKNNRY